MRRGHFQLARVMAQLAVFFFYLFVMALYASETSQGEEIIGLDFGEGSGEDDTCSPYTDNFRTTLEKLQFLSNVCAENLQFDNCCQPKFLRFNWLASGIYPMSSDGLSSAYCDMETDGGGWMVILRRSGSKRRFYRTLRGYKKFFGKLDRDFWLGLDNIHYYTSNAGPRGAELRIELVKNGTKYYALYSNFYVGAFWTRYTLQVGGYSNESTLPDSLSYSNGETFTTYDQEDDSHPRKCTQVYQDAWWHKISGNESCTKVSLLKDMNSVPKGLIWEIDGEKVGFDYAEMKIRPLRWECNLNQYDEALLRRALHYRERPELNLLNGLLHG